MLIVGGIGAAYPEVIAHDLTVDGKVVVGSIVPVGPVQRSVGRRECLVECLLSGVVFFQRLTCRILYLQEFVAAGCQHEYCCTETCYDDHMLFHIEYSFIC